MNINNVKIVDYAKLVNKSSTLESKVDSLNTDITNGKAALVSAITEQGLTIDSTLPFKDMVSKIKDIAGAKYNAGCEVGKELKVTKIYQNGNGQYGDVNYTFTKKCKFAVGTLIGEYNGDTGKDGSYNVVAPHGHVVVQDAGVQVGGSAKWKRTITVLFLDCAVGDTIRLYGSFNANITALTIAE